MLEVEPLPHALTDPRGGGRSGADGFVPCLEVMQGRVRQVGQRGGEQHVVDIGSGVRLEPSDSLSSIIRRCDGDAEPGRSGCR